MSPREKKLIDAALDIDDFILELSKKYELDSISISAIMVARLTLMNQQTETTDLYRGLLMMVLERDTALKDDDDKPILH